MTMSTPVTTNVLVGVAAGLTPLLLVPLDSGALAALRTPRLELAWGGERDFLLKSDEPATPSIFDVVWLEERDCITA